MNRKENLTRRISNAWYLAMTVLDSTPVGLRPIDKPYKKLSMHHSGEKFCGCRRISDRPLVQRVMHDLYLFPCPFCYVTKKKRSLFKEPDCTKISPDCKAWPKSKQAVGPDHHGKSYVNKSHKNELK
jgi:hypothetical protein